MQKQRKVPRTALISFSGIDGAGKSTQIERLCAAFKRSGLSFRLVLFWEQVARFASLRESTGHAVFGGDRGIGTASAPINRRDKNVRSWAMTCARLFFYCADAISLRLLISAAKKSGVDALVFDRFIYDELANLPLQNPILRAYARALAKIVPKPDISFLLDADPILARARKPEYPLEFLHFNRGAYFKLNHLIGVFTVIAPAPVCEVEKEIMDFAFTCLSAAPGRGANGPVGITNDKENGPMKTDRPQAETAVS